MKKYIVLALLIVPMTSFAAPSVRVLGNKTGGGTATAPAVKVTPAKTAVSSGESANASRIGTLRAKTKVSTPAAATSGSASGTAAKSSSNSRFPAISPAHSYNANTTPSNANQNVVAGGLSEDDVKALVDDKLTNYYDKATVYDTDDFEDSVKSTVEKIDDPRIDAIRLGKPEHDTELPGNYAYIWIE